MKDLKKLHEDRARAWEQMKNIVDRAEAEQREMTPEETTEWNKWDGEYEARNAEITRLSTLEAREKEIAAQKIVEKPAEVDSKEARAAAFEKYLRYGLKNLSTEERANLHFRAQSKGTDSEGGYLVPDEWANAIEQAMLAFGGVRGVATTVRSTVGGQMFFPTNNDTGNSGAILSENTQVSEQDTVFSQVVLDDYTYTSKLVRVSNQLLADQAFNLAGYLTNILAERVARAQNAHFTTGTGSSQPKGIVTAAAAGVTAASVSAITFDELIDLIHSVDPSYRGNAAFMFEDATLKAVKKLKDSNNMYLWSAPAAGEPGTISGYRYVVNQDMASIGASAKSVIFGDLSKYLIRDIEPMTVMRLNERYADYNQTAFVMFHRTDGDLLDAGTNPVKYLAHPAT